MVSALQRAGQQDSVRPISACIPGGQDIVRGCASVDDAFDRQDARAIEKIARPQLPDDAAICCRVSGRDPQLAAIVQDQMNHLMGCRQALYLRNLLSFPRDLP